MHSNLITRRALLAAVSAGAAGCARKKATRIAGYCFVANQGGKSVAAVSLERFRVVKQIPLETAPSTVLAHPSKPKLLVLGPEAGTVYEIDAQSLAVKRRARGGNVAVDMRLSPAQDALWVLYRDPAELVEFPIDSLQAGRRIKLAVQPDAFDLVAAPKGPMAAVSSVAAQQIVLASLPDSTVVRTIGAGAEPSLVTFRQDARQVISASASDRSATIFDVATGKTVVRLPLSISPRHLCQSADGGQIFLTGDGADAVAVVFPYSTEVYQTILAGHAPGAMAVTAAGNRFAYLLVTNPESDRVSVLDVSLYKLVSVVQVGHGPGQIILTPDGQYALVLNERSGDMAVIRLMSLATAPNGGQRRYGMAPVFTMIPVGDRPVAAAVVMVA